MIENLDDLTFKQKEDLQKFVNIAYKNKDMWWANGDPAKGEPIVLSLSDYFNVDLLNEIFINFPITSKDVNDKEINKVLQLISEYEVMVDYTPPSLYNPETPLHCFRFKNQEDIVNNVRINVENLSELDTQELLDSLQSVLESLKTDKFDIVKWNEQK